MGWLASVAAEEETRSARISVAAATARARRASEPVGKSPPVVFGNHGPAPPGKPHFRHTSRSREQPWAQSSVRPLPTWSWLDSDAREAAAAAEVAAEAGKWRAKRSDEQAKAAARRVEFASATVGHGLSERRADDSRSPWIAVPDASARRDACLTEADAIAEALAPHGVERSVLLRALVPPSAK
jgi:hypothetical protein